MDTNSDPEGIDFPIPGNDDARRAIDLYCNLMKETINNAKNLKPELDNTNEDKINKQETQKIEIKNTENNSIN